METWYTAEDGRGLFEIHLGGEIDAACKPELQRIAAAYQGAVDLDVVVDLGEVAFIGATGLAWLADLEHVARDRKRRLVLRHVPHTARRIIQLTGLAGILLEQSLPDDDGGHDPDADPSAAPRLHASD